MGIQVNIAVHICVHIHGLRMVNFSSSFFPCRMQPTYNLPHDLSSLRTFFFKRQYFIKEFQKTLSRDLSSRACNP